MTPAPDPTDEMRRAARTFPDVEEGQSCNQTAFKVGKGAFLFLGPGAKGLGFKAMFRLDHSRPEAEQLAAAHPERFEVGRTGWVTARFSGEQPLQKPLWRRWLAESYALTSGTPTQAKKPRRG